MKFLLSILAVFSCFAFLNCGSIVPDTSSPGIISPGAFCPASKLQAYNKCDADKCPIGGGICQDNCRRSNCMVF